MSSPGRSDADGLPSDRSATPPSTSAGGDASSSSSTETAPAPVASSPSTSHDPPPSSSLPPPPATAEGTVNPPPRIPWTGRIPTFFHFGPDGQLIPVFHAPPAPPNQPSSPPTHITFDPLSGDQGDQSGTNASDGNAPANPPNPNPNSHDNPLPFSLRPGPAGAPHFHLPPLPPWFPFMMPMASERRADPEAAAELLRSLPAVEKPLFRRVENVIKAEQVQDGDNEEDSGWRCGVCLEGVEPDAKETGVKALPCNHLFHGDCLEPWFQTNDTCPTCRMDLDPLKTLNRNQRGGVRPGATGTGRNAPRPYNRGAGPFMPPAVGIEPNGLGANFTFVWQMPVPPGMPDTPAQAEGGGTEGTGAQQNRPQTPTLRFNFPLSSSPAPMNRERSASPMTRTDSMAGDGVGPPLASGTGAAPSVPEPAPEASDNAAGQPQPRRQITIIHHRHDSPSAPASPHHHHHIHVHPGSPHHHHHHHHLRPPGASTPIPAAATPPRDTAPPAAEEPSSTNQTSSILGHGTASPDSRGPATPTDQAQTSNINTTPARPHFHFFFNLSDRPPTAGDRTEVGSGTNVPTGDPTTGDPAPAPSDPPATATPPPPRQTLAEWVATRERSLGWRCDAPDCGIAPTGEEADEDIEMPLAADKEMLSIYSPLQPPAVNLSPGNAAAFELHACEHRWHRTCLETVERSSGRSLRPDMDGRVWVKCETCRKEGWIWPRTRSMSEGEVERLCAGN